MIWLISLASNLILSFLRRASICWKFFTLASLLFLRVGYSNKTYFFEKVDTSSTIPKSLKTSPKRKPLEKSVSKHVTILKVSRRGAYL
jgi:hypothetical protein